MTHSKYQTTPQQPDDKHSNGLPEIANNQPKNIWGAVLLVGGLLAAGGFFLLKHHVNSRDTTNINNESFSVDTSGNPPPLTPQQVEKLKSVIQNTIPAPSSDAQKEMLNRIHAPVMIVNMNASPTATTANNGQNFTNNQPKSDPNIDFLNQSTNQGVTAENATVLKNRSQLIAQGNLIHAVLESAINSDLPGMVRATVSEPIYSENGTQVLITPGSRLIGQYRSGMMTGQSRIFIVWTRLIEPNGLSIMLGSPGVDNLGAAGQATDSIDYHFWQMFGSATLLSLLGAGASNVGVSGSDNYNASQGYRQAVSQSLAQSSNNSLQQNTSIPPTLHIEQGKPIMVFVAKDLNFGSAMQKINQKINIF